MKLSFDHLDRIWITSDSHAFHVNITRGTSTWGTSGEFKLRDFYTPEQMTAQMATNFNSVIPEDGILFHFPIASWNDIRKGSGCLGILILFVLISTTFLLFGCYKSEPEPYKIQCEFVSYNFSRCPPDWKMYADTVYTPVEIWSDELDYFKKENYRAYLENLQLQPEQWKEVYQNHIPHFQCN